MAGPDIKNIGELPGPIPDVETPAPEPDTKNLDALLDSLNGSAERFQTLWFSFLGLTLYLAIAALTTTHRNLLLGEAQTLPILNIKVPLLPFYVIAPLLYLVFHFYLLMMLQLLARTAAPFETQLLATLPFEADRELYRARVENALFLQLLIGRKDERAGMNSLLLALIALITVVLAPLATLILMQLQFLPYHSFGITWWQRAVVFTDLGVLFFMWRFFFYSGVENPVFLLRDRPRLRSRPVLIAILCILIATMGWLSLWEGRWAGEPGIGRRDLASTENGVVFSLFPDRMKLHGETIVGKETLDKTKDEMVSRGGEFSFVPTIKLDGRDLQGADLSGADLRGASLDGAALQGANLNVARLDRASLFNADLRGAILVAAQLRGADLDSAKLQGAELNNSGFQGANLPFAKLQGADLFGAHLEGAILEAAQLQGTRLSYAELQGADLRSAQLQGAALLWTGLQGAELGGVVANKADPGAAVPVNADLSDSEFDKTFVFRTRIGNANLATASLRSVVSGKLRDPLKAEALDDADVDKWIAAATRFAPEHYKAQITGPFLRLKSGFHEEDANETKWSGMEEASLALDPDGAHHRRRLAGLLGSLACDADGAPYVARGLLRYSRLDMLGDQLEGVRKRMKDGREKLENCLGVAGFTEKDWKLLDELKPTEAAPGDH